MGLGLLRSARALAQALFTQVPELRVPLLRVPLLRVLVPQLLLNQLLLGPVFITGCSIKPLTYSEPPASASAYREPQLFNQQWQFFRNAQPLKLEAAQSQNHWLAVSLPHTAHIEPKIVNSQWQGDAWYKKTFFYQAHWRGKKVVLDFEGAMNASTVWLNGVKVSAHLGGYLPFSVDLTAALVRGANTLLVRLDNRDNPMTGPKPLNTLDFNMYGGIYRNVWLRIENPIHITNPVEAGEVASGGVFVSFPKVNARTSEILVKTHIAHRGQGENLRVVQRLLNNKKYVTSAQTQLKANLGRGVSVAQTLTVPEPKLWSPKSPNLYELQTWVLVDDVIVDQELTSVGIRQFRLDKGRLFINGEETFLRGVNRHQEYPYIGYALSDAAQYRDAEKIKAAGFDYVRLSHYPHSKAFMHAADQLGLVLVDAILGWQYISKHPNFLDHVVQTCRDMIRRDRNHASVLAWECSLNESWMPDTLIDRFHSAVHEELPGNNVYSAGWQEYAYDIYLQARQHRLKHYENPSKPYVVSEYGDWEYYAMNAGLQQDSWAGLKQAARSSRQQLGDGDIRLQQQASNVSEAHNDNFNTPAFADGYWVMFDYNRGYADNLEASGVMSIDRLPKFSHYFYQSQRRADEFAGPLAGGYMAFIATHWTPESRLKFKVYSNADEVALYLNDRQVARAKPNTEQYANLAQPPFEFSLEAFVPGTLTAKALKNGAVVATHQISTPGEVKALALAMDKSGKLPQGNVNDVIFVYATLLDQNQNNSRVNGRLVTFTVQGDATLVSPGQLRTEDGTAAALIKVGSDLASIKVSASYAGFTAALRLKQE